MVVERKRGKTTTNITITHSFHLIHKQEAVMYRPWLTIVFAVFVLSLWSAPTWAQTGDVTFGVRMNIKMLEGTFQPGSGDIVRVAGSFNDWGNSTDTLSDGDGDSIYTFTRSIATGSIDYKFLKTLRGGSDWEGGNNRNYTVVSGAQTVPTVYFDYDSVYTPPVNAPVTFQVNMRVKMLEDTFLPGSGDYVRVAGSFNDWGNSTDTLSDGDGDSVYTKTISLLENQLLQYKFLKIPARGQDWEDGGNREYTVPIGGGTVPVAYFNYDSVVNTPVTANILWNINMAAFETLGWFNPTLGDSMQVRGAFQGWGNGNPMTPNIFNPSLYEHVLGGYNGTIGDMMQHKFYMDLDSASAVARFPGYASDMDGFNYEHPATQGDGNRIYNLTGASNQTTDPFFYADVNPAGLLGAGDSVNVTLKVNMAPATQYSVPFDIATDTVKVFFWDALWRSVQTNVQTAFPNPLTMTRNSGSDSIFVANFKVKGPTHYTMMYFYRYNQPGGSEVNEGGGLGAANPYRSRFIQPLGPNSWPASYSAPTDLWQKNPPMPAEAPPFTTDIIEVGNGVPLVYDLSQNYPNPFNPATRINYAIPVESRVSLKVFNVLGQQVASLVDGVQPAGNYIAFFEAAKMPTGVYFYRLEAGNFSQVKKMMLLK